MSKKRKRQNGTRQFVIADLVSSAHAWAGFGCLNAWPWSLNSIFAPHPSAPSPENSLVFALFSLTGFALALASYRGQPLSKSLIVFIACPIIIIASCLYLAAPIWPSLFFAGIPHAIFSSSISLAGIAQGLLFTKWVGMFGHTDPRWAIIRIAASSVVGTCALLPGALLPSSVRGVVPVVLACVACLCFVLLKREGGASILKSSPRPRDNTRDGHLPWKLMITAFVPGLCFGFQQNLLVNGTYGDTTWNIYGIGSFTIAAVLYLVVTLALRMDFNRMIYHYAYVLMAVGCLLGIMSQQPAGFAYGVFAIGYRCFDSLLWCLCSFLIYRQHLQADWLAGICVGSSLLGRFLGFSSIPQELGLLTQAQVPCALGCLLFIVLLTALLLENSNNIHEAWGAKQPAEDGRNIEEINRACLNLASKWGLTAREVDVLIAAVHLESRKEIAQSLQVSEETVKTHLGNLYRKSGLHSRDDIHQQIAKTIRATEREPKVSGPGHT